MKRRLILHPFLFAAYPVLALLAWNVDQTAAGEALRALVAAALGALLLTALGKPILKDWGRAGLMASLLLALFFSYGHLYLSIEGQSIGGFVFGRHRFLAPLWGALLVAGVWWIWRRTGDTWELTRTLNTVGLVALVFPLYTILSFNLRAQFIETPALQPPADLTAPGDAERLPDVYYIVVDAYARQDILDELYGFDNSAFITFLTETGFVVPSGSHSNYTQTTLSFASTLNLNYVQDLLGPLDPKSGDKQPLTDLIQHNQARSALENLGYTTVAFSSGFSATEFRDAQVYLAPNAQDMQTGDSLALNAFEGLLLQTTAARLLTEGSAFLPDWLKPDFAFPYQAHRTRILYALDTVTDLPETGGPKFVFLHILSPHPPFVFGAEGGEVESQEPFTLKASGAYLDRSAYIEGYVNQMIYLNSRLEEVINAIIANSDVPPIIILHADHGPGASAIGGEASPVNYLEERLSILNAYYLPGCAPGRLYETITPVNTFRWVFNQCFGGDFDLLEDRSFNSPYGLPYDFEEAAFGP